MLTQIISPELEAFVADAVAHLAAELRLVDLGDYVAYMRMDRLCCIADIVRDAGELFFAPGFVEFDMDGDAAAEWGATPEVTLMLVLTGMRTKTRVTLTLCEDHAEVKLGYVDIAEAFRGRNDQAALLVDDITDNMLRRQKGYFPVFGEMTASTPEIPSR